MLIVSQQVISTFGCIHIGCIQYRSLDCRRLHIVVILRSRGNRRDQQQQQQQVKTRPIHRILNLQVLLLPVRYSARLGTW